MKPLDSSSATSYVGNTMKSATKWEAGIETKATMVPTHSGMFQVSVIHRFDSGNFVKEKPIDNLSEVAAAGLLTFYTR